MFESEESTLRRPFLPFVLFSQLTQILSCVMLFLLHGAHASLLRSLKLSGQLLGDKALAALRLRGRREDGLSARQAREMSHPSR